MITSLLIIHGLLGVALLGAITHQWVALVRRQPVTGGSFVDRYSGINQGTFTLAVVGLYVADIILGAIVYPSYRLNVRIPFEEMQLNWAVGLFELKEHFGAIGLGILPQYVYVWRTALPARARNERLPITSLVGLIVWWNFLIGHVLNNIRGLA
jgi:hypothetical protein